MIDCGSRLRTVIRGLPSPLFLLHFLCIDRAPHELEIQPGSHRGSIEPGFHLIVSGRDQIIINIGHGDIIPETGLNPNGTQRSPFDSLEGSSESVERIFHLVWFGVRLEPGDVPLRFTSIVSAMGAMASARIPFLFHSTQVPTQVPILSALVTD